MVADYDRKLYQPAHAADAELRAGNLALAHDRARWNARISQVWDRVRFLETAPQPIAPVTSGNSLPVRAVVEMAGLGATDVRVEVVIGKVGSTGSLEDTETYLLPATEQNGSVAVFAMDLTPQTTGRLGYALRISPNHFHDPLTRPCSSLLKWAAIS
jgi:starch phosphorylase